MPCSLTARSLADKQPVAPGEQPKDRPVYPWDLNASMYTLLGIDPTGKLPHPHGCVAYVTPSATLAEATQRIESLGNLAKAAISLKADPAPPGITVKAANIAADQNEATVTLTVTKQAPVGFRQNIILSGTLRVGPETIIRVAPAIPINVLAAEQPQK